MNSLKLDETDCTILGALIGDASTKLKKLKNLQFVIKRYCKKNQTLEKHRCNRGDNIALGFIENWLHAYGKRVEETLINDIEFSVNNRFGKNALK